MRSGSLKLRAKLRVGLISSAVSGVSGHRDGFPELKIKKVQAVDKGFDLNQI